MNTLATILLAWSLLSIPASLLAAQIMKGDKS